MIEIEKYARAAASTARTPPNSPARRAALEAENAARVAAEQFVKGLEAERDELRAKLDEIEAQEPVAKIHADGYWTARRGYDPLPDGKAFLSVYACPVPAQAVPDGWRTCGDTGDVHTVGGQWRGECTACDAAEILRMRAQIERLQHPADQADQIDVRSIVGALSWLGVSTPEGGTEAAAAQLGRLVNYLSAAVLRHKIDHRNKCEEIERMRGALLWTLWHHQGGSSPIGHPIRRALGMGQFDPMTPEQIECGQRFATTPSR